MIAERVERLDQGMVSRYLRAIHEKIEAEPKIRKWFRVSLEARNCSQD